QAPQRQGVHAVAGFRDGSRLVGDRLVVGEESLKIDLSGGLTWTAALEDLVSLQPLGGRVTYLSDLKADGYRHVPFLDLQWPYRTDRNCSGGMLRSGGRLYLKGLGVHSAARLSYLLAKPYDRFQAELGIDDDTAGLGSVRFRVFVDGEEKHTSDTIRGGTPPVPVSVDLAGAKRFDLIVDFADRADEQDHANWLDARLVVPAPPAVSDAGP
ncbi:MAG: NPCBM/NEW2 domain-containing protein, partial [Planctomycetota bacterium]